MAHRRGTEPEWTKHIFVEESVEVETSAVARGIELNNNSNIMEKRQIIVVYTSPLRRSSRGFNGDESFLGV